MKITSPNASYSGRQVYGETVLDFDDGVAEAEDIPAGVRQYLAGAGYGLDEAPPGVIVGVIVGADGSETLGHTLFVADDLDTRTIEDLRGYAAEYGVDLSGKTRKDDIVEAIRAHFAAIPDAPQD